MYLSDLLQNIYSDLGQTDPVLGNFVATGGSVSTIINTGWATLENPPEEDSLKNRYAFITSTTDGLAPQGQWSKVTAYVDSTNTMTITTLATAVGANDVIQLPKQDLFPLQEVIARVNRALTNLGNVVVPDTSISTSALGYYDLPVALKNKKPRSMFYGSDDDGWYPISDYVIEPAAAGTVGKLFLYNVPSGYTVKIFYHGIHPYVSAYNSVVYEGIHPNVITLKSIIEVLNWYNNRDENQGANEFYLWMVGEKKKELMEELMRNPIEKPDKTPRYFTDVLPISGELDARNKGG